MEKILFDSHAHISDEAYFTKEGAHDALIDGIRGSQLRFCMDIGTSLQGSKDAVCSAHSYDFCYATVGIHPSEIEELTEEKLNECLSAFENDDKVVAIGEIGLDYHFDDAPSKEMQAFWFGKQLDWAIEHNAPICIHSRDADNDTLSLLKEHGAFSEKRAGAFPKKPDGSNDCRVLLHCFSGSAELAKQYLKLGASISLGGPVTFKNARHSVEVAKAVPLTDLLIETDSPFLAPEPLRGTRNTPVNVRYVCEKIAEIKGISYEEAAKITCENAMRFYGIKE